MDETEAALRRFERRMRNVERMDRSAEALACRADEIDRGLAEPPEARSLEDDNGLRAEARSLRAQAERLTQDADGVQRRLYRQPPAHDADVEVWAKRQTRWGDLDWER